MAEIINLRQARKSRARCAIVESRETVASTSSTITSTGGGVICGGDGGGWIIKGCESAATNPRRRGFTSTKCRRRSVVKRPEAVAAVG